MPTLTGPIKDLGITDLDARGIVEATLESNASDTGFVGADGALHLDRLQVTVTNGVLTITDVPDTGDIEGLRLRLHLNYQSVNPGGVRKRKTWTSGWFEATADLTLADIADIDMPNAPAITSVAGAVIEATTAATTATAAKTDAQAAQAAAEAARDSAHDISNIDTSDDVVSTLLDPSVGPKTTTALDARIAAPLAEATFTSRYSILGSGSSERVGVGTTDPATKNYGTRAAAHLSTDLGISVGDTNAGASGANTTQLLTYLPSWLDSRRPHVVTIELSINDVNLASAVDHDTTLANIGKQVALTRLAGATPVLVITPAINPWQYGNVGQQTDSTQLLYATLRTDALALAATLGVPVADGHLALRHMVDILADGVHMNDHGADSLGQVLAAAIEGHPITDLSTQIFTDDFTTWDDAAWTPTVGTWTAEAGKARSATGGDGEIALRETSRADHAFFADLSWASGAADGGIVARGASDGTGYLAALYPNGANTDLRLYSLTGAGADLLTSAASVPVSAAGAELGVTVSGTNILVWLDGKPWLSCSDATHTGTKVGMRQQANTALRFDNARASY